MANKKYLIYSGQKINNLTVIKEVAFKDKHGQKERFAECICDCGKITNVRIPSLFRKGRPTRTCGCLIDDTRISHGQSNTSLYEVWNVMKGRIRNINNKRYKDYGGRGILICKRWKSFENFMNWSLKNGYEKGLSIDRINNNGNYSPQNCRWTTMIVQQNNTRRNKIIEYNNEKLTLANFCRKYNLNYPVFNSRLRIGHSIKEAMENCIKITSDGKTKRIARYKYLK